ncbi:MAG: hypothetical protein FWF01_00270 [Alphaproteobacteria bacterium]|nr:hypothetical protein [Alphaproteobacteria bacterium]
MPTKTEASSLVNAFRQLVSSVNPEPPPLPEEFQKEIPSGKDLPKSDDQVPAAAPPQDEVLADGIAVSVIAKVISQSGRQIPLNMTIRKIYTKNQILIVYGFVQEFERDKAIAVRDIVSFRDIATGVDYNDAFGFIRRDILGSEDVMLANILSVMRHDLTVLTFVAKLYPRVSNKEMAIVLDYVRKRYGKKIDNRVVESYISHLTPDAEAVKEAMGYIIKRSTQEVDQFIQTCVHIIVIDDTIHEAEREFLKRLKKYCEDHDIEFKIK